MTEYQQYFVTPTTTTSRTTSTTSSSSSSMSHGAGRVLNPDELESIRQAYVTNIGPLKAPIAHYLENCLQTMETALVINAIEETGWASRPSPQYLRAILERYKREGLDTMVKLDHQKSERMVDYDQRQYDENWYDGLFINLLDDSTSLTK